MSASGGRLEGRVAIITGAGQGIGEGIAKVYARAGAKLVLTGRTLEKLETVADAIRTDGGAVRCLVALSGQRADAARTVNEAMSAFGRIDVLVNNAQTFTDMAPVETIPEENLRINFDTGVIGALQLMQCAFPHMRERGGSIINLGSINGYACDPGLLAYAASKGAMRTLTKTAAREWGKYKIRVNTLVPAVITPYVESYLKETGTYEMQLAKTALGYIGNAEKDVAPLALFLASDESHYVTGQTINADSGMLMH